jgi:hypothetical protein
VEVDEVSMQQGHFVHHTAQVSPVVFSTLSLHWERLWLYIPIPVERDWDPEQKARMSV